MEHQLYPHPLTRLDSRVKLLCAIALLVMVLSYRGISFPLLVAFLAIGACLHMGVGLRMLMIRLAQPLMITAVLLILKLFSGHTPVFSISFAGIAVTGYAEGLKEGVEIVARVAGAVSVVTLVGFATPFTDLMAALAWLRVPRGVIEVTMFAWRYLFTLFEDSMVIYNAQKNRLGYVGYRRGLRSFGTLAGSLVIKAFDNSQTLTCAMMQRGYDGSMPLLRQKPLRAGEIFLSCLFVAGMGVAWIW